MELTVKDVTKIEKTEDNGDESVSFRTAMKDDDETITVSVKEDEGCSFTPGDRCELKVTNRQTTLVPIKKDEPKKRGPKPKKG